MKNIFFSLFLGFIFITSCDKKNKPIRVHYPEDTQDYDATPSERISNKWWVLDSVSLNGIDYTDTVFNTVGEYKLFLSTTEDSQSGVTVKFGNLFTSIPLLESNDNYMLITWAIADKLYMNFSTGPIKQGMNTFAPMLFPPRYENYSKWNILYLTPNNFKLLLSKNDTTIVNYFKLQ